MKETPLFKDLEFGDPQVQDVWVAFYERWELEVILNDLYDEDKITQEIAAGFAKVADSNLDTKLRAIPQGDWWPRFHVHRQEPHMSIYIWASLPGDDRPTELGTIYVQDMYGQTAVGFNWKAMGTQPFKVVHVIAGIFSSVDLMIHDLEEWLGLLQLEEDEDDSP